jgi:hypothetical protein
VKTKTSRGGEQQVKTTQLHLRSPDLLLTSSSVQAVEGQGAITHRRRFEKTNPSGAARRRAGENGTGEQVKTETSRGSDLKKRTQFVARTCYEVPYVSIRHTRESGNP